MSSRRYATLVTCILTIGAGPVAAAAPEAEGDPPGFGVTASIGAGAGDSSSTLKALAPDPSDDQQLVDIRSDLVFPLDGLFVQVDAAWRPTGRTTVTASLGRNLTQPVAPMTNSDFVDDRPYLYVESKAQIANWSASVETRVDLTDRPRVTAGLLGSVDYQHIDAFIAGYEGFQYSLFSDTRVAISQTLPVLDYEVSYLSPRLGGFARRSFGDHVQLELGGSLGLAIAWDADDHLLRARTSVGSGLGPGAEGWARADLRSPFRAAAWLSAHLAGGVRTLRAQGTTTQTFDTGTQYEGIPYTLRCRTGYVQLGLSVSPPRRRPMRAAGDRAKPPRDRR